MKKNLYKEAGVDIDKGSAFVRAIKPMVESTFRPEVMTKIGGFAGCVSLNLERYKKPILVSSADGVGTKLKIAFMMDRHDTVGIDLVAMCVNDIVVTGAKPLFFLDYLASGRLDTERAKPSALSWVARRRRCPGSTKKVSTIWRVLLWGLWKMPN